MQEPRIEIHLAAIEKIAARRLVAGGHGPVQFDQRERPTFVARDETQPLRVHLTYGSIGVGAQLHGVRIERLDGSEPTRADVDSAVRRLPFYMAQVEATLDGDEHELRRLVDQMKRERRRPYQHLNNEFLEKIASDVRELEASGEPAVGRALAQRYGRSEATASRWISAARERFERE